ncbi:uncharacterized protein MONOS_2019 [Monocercomonoides exilis]|uniref:uncharacterized protein n=1 Tax=Monocercomonoides exilis TaxID=2049356 RepID=UPI00355A8E14|nr:hypothetical protein MONOS_2019 [Monocercomonoides exilis]|eukprot:MONOS_2019.1-p1 / transcript=MONOS_2019.1 / gene=MONOS_2019 / organism=Monocercomonoides_exilis_PA203 / gene_product=unspecified product / transcript_product=unspecified product / location=Mono_scaffold00039:59021-61003(+) / protein_length=661 / sequence_SO=supercontig / SO=protein_coding / is_pseudo=false
MMKLGLLQRWMNEDRKILNHEVLETQSVKLQSSPLPSFESYQPFSTNQPTNKLLPSSSIILQRNGMANQSESDEIEIDYEKTSEHIEKSENPKISTIDGAKTNVSERNVMTRRKRQLVKKQIHEAKKYKRAFGEWIRKDWITNEEEAHMWDIAEAKLKIANNNTLVDDYKKTKTESLNETVQIKSGKCDDAKEEGCEKADENFTEKQHNNRQTLEELKNQLKEEILAIAALTTATKSDQSTSFHSDEFNSGSSAPSSLGDAKAKLAELKEQISKKERKLAQKAVSCGLSDIERFSWLKDKTKVPDSRAYASESSFLTYFLSDNKVDPRFWSPPVPRPAVGCLFDSDKEEASEECEENTTEDEGGEEEEPTCQLFDGTQNIPSFPFPFLIDEEKDDFQTKQLQTSNSTTSENMKSTYILKQPPDISFDPLSISVSSLKQTSHSSLMNDSFRPTASTVILNGKNFTSNSSLLYRCSEYEQFREEKPCYVEFNSTFKAKNEEEKTNLLISSCLPKNSSQKGASAGNSVSSLELALSSFTQTGQLSFPPSLQSSSSSSSFASNTSVVCDLPPSLIPIDFSEMLPRFTDPTTNVRRIKRMRQRKINPMLFVQQSSLPFLEVKETPPLILPFFCYLNILICQRRRWDSMHYRKAEAQRRRNEMLKL